MIKQEKAAADYEAKSTHPHERCEICHAFLPMYSTCKKVKGKVALHGWCKLGVFKKDTAAA